MPFTKANFESACDFHAHILWVMIGNSHNKGNNTHGIISTTQGLFMSVIIDI